MFCYQCEQAAKGVGCTVQGVLVPVGAAVMAHRAVLNRLDALGATWVLGNHDDALAPLIGTPLMIDHPLFKTACHPFEETIGGRKFAFLHGHEADPYCCDPNPGTGEITAIITGMLEDRNKGPFATATPSPTSLSEPWKRP